ncbi:MAG: homoserine kinase [Thermoplasmataceae archaeon]
MDQVTALSYSSSANLGPGYDLLALAHDAFHDSVTAMINPAQGRIPLTVNGMDGLTDPKINTAGLSVLNLLHDNDINEPVSLYINKGIPAGLGLGSSGASAAAAVSAVSELFNLKLSSDEKVKYAMLGEIASSGTPHADNVAASIHGGFVVIESVSPIRVRRLRIHDSFSFLTVIPSIHIKDKTKMCRTLVPDRIPITSYIQNARYITELVAGLTGGDRELVKNGMNDIIVEAARKPLYPYYEKMKTMMLESGAAGVCISGAGPSIMAVVDSFTDLQKIRTGVEEVFAPMKISYRIVESKISGGTEIERNPAGS